MCILCLCKVYTMCIQCIYNVYAMCIRSEFHVHNVYTMCVQCRYNVYAMCTDLSKNYFVGRLHQKYNVSNRFPVASSNVSVPHSSSRITYTLCYSTLLCSAMICSTVLDSNLVYSILL